MYIVNLIADPRRGDTTPDSRLYIWIIESAVDGETQVIQYTTIWKGRSNSELDAEKWLYYRFGEKISVMWNYIVEDYDT